MAKNFKRTLFVDGVAEAPRLCSRHQAERWLNNAFRDWSETVKSTASDSAAKVEHTGSEVIVRTKAGRKLRFMIEQA